MALRVAVASGNWSNPAIWNGGVLPTVGDIVASNTYTVTIDQNINVDSLTNTAQAVVGAVPVMTSNITPSGIVTASFANGLNLTAWYAFDGRTDTGNFFQATLTPGDFIGYEFTSPKAIDQFTIFLGGPTGSPVSITAQGWNGTAWVNLLTVSISGTTTSALFGNSTPYIKYRLLFNSAVYIQIREVSFFEYLGTTPATAGGGFILNDGVTVTCTGSTSISSASSTCLTYAGTSSATVNCSGNILTPTSANIRTINITSGTLNITALNLLGTTNGTNNKYGISISGSSSVLNYTGDIRLGTGDYGGIIATTLCTVNIVGNVKGAGGNNFGAMNGVNFSGAILTITGNVEETGGTGSPSPCVAISSGIVTITGSVTGSSTTGVNHGITVAGNGTRLTVIGSVIGQVANGITASASIYLNISGALVSSGFTSVPAVSSTNAGAINILTGPFISSTTGIQPFYVTRMHYQRTMGSYYEFRDSSTNGALPPAGAAPATRLVSPDTVVDAPIPANVRQGIVYASGSQTGTMIVPSPSNVANNVPVDNTLGTAVLDPNAIWAVPLTSINTLNSIGRRVKNAATVETTGAQIQTTLNNNE